MRLRRDSEPGPAAADRGVPVTRTVTCAGPVGDSPETLSGMRRPGPRRPALAREAVARDRAAAGCWPAGSGCGGFKPGLGAATTAGETIMIISVRAVVPGYKYSFNSFKAPQIYS